MSSYIPFPHRAGTYLNVCVWSRLTLVLCDWLCCIPTKKCHLLWRSMLVGAHGSQGQLSTRDFRRFGEICGDDGQNSDPVH